MKKTLFLLLVLFVISGVSQAVAYEYDFGVSVGDTVEWDEEHSGRGGVFGFTVIDSNDFSNIGNSWSTFCAEMGQWLPNQGIVSGFSYSNNSNGGTLTNTAAWAYWTFTQNNLAGYDGSENDQKDLQELIWFEMGQISVADYLDEDQVDNWLTSAAGWVNDGRVQVLNFTGQGQDVLVAATNPVPEPASMALLGIGLIGLVVVGRKKVKKN